MIAENTIIIASSNRDYPMQAKMGSLVIDLLGKSLMAEEQELLNHPLVGGVILFTRNYDTIQQLSKLCHAIRTSRKQPILIMVDQEGGRVQRFINEFTRLPAMHLFGTLYEKNSQQAYHLAKECGWLMAMELLSAGIDLSLAPVLDLNKQKNKVIGDRAFHEKPEIVVFLAKGWMQGMHEAGMAAIGKHFPGHGAVTVDSHAALPIDERPFNEIQQDDLIPFMELSKAGIDALMAAHIIFPRVDEKAVGFSFQWLHEILRKQLKFTGAILSDDLNMEGANISSNYADRVAAAREAGCDFTLLCNNRQGVIQVLDNIGPASYLLEAEQWQLLQGKFSLSPSTFKLDQRWKDIQTFLTTQTTH